MSAFICSPEHIAELAIFAARSQESIHVPRVHMGEHPDHAYEPETLAAEYAYVLYQENIKSVKARYPNCNDSELPGPIDRPDSIAIGYDQIARPKVKDIVNILKMCDCLQYQSCETDEYELSKAYRLLSAIRSAAIRELPGYDGAPWEYWEE